MDNQELNERLRSVVPQVRLVLLKEPSGEPYFVNNPGDVEKIVEPIKYYAEEHFISLHLSIKNQIIGYHTVAQGTLTETLVHPREVFKAAILNNAYSIIVVHNHPSDTGSVKPSNEDYSATKQLIAAGKLIGVTVTDHIVVGSGTPYSFRQEHPDLWESQVQQLPDKKDDKAVDKIQDFWLVYEIEKGLPRLNGDSDNIIPAETVRRRQILDLIKLKQIISDRAMNVLEPPATDEDLLKEFARIGVAYLEGIGNREQAEDWLSTSSVKYDWEWVQKEWLNIWKEREISMGTYNEERYQKIIKAYFHDCIMEHQSSTEQQQVKLAA